MTIFATGAVYVIFPKIIVPDDAATTVSNLIAEESLFRAGIACLIVVAMLDVLVAWALYLFLKPVDRSLSLLAAWFRLVYSAILCFALFRYIDVLYLISDENYPRIVGVEFLQSRVMLSINAFDKGWGVGLVFFGVHLALAGYLILKSSHVPKLLGIVLAAAGFAYIVDNIGMIVLQSYDLGIAGFVGWGELLLMVWLLHKGGKEKWM